MRTIILLTITILFSCKAQKEIQPMVSSTPSPPVYIYKTTGDYFINVPVILSEDKTEIVSYPDPSDVMIGSKLAVPTKLTNGFLLDNRGINKNVAFLNYSYSDYYNLKEAPSIEKLMEAIKDKNPLVELYYCGQKSNFQNVEKELNKIIKKSDLTMFIKLK